MKDASDELLEASVRDWAATQAVTIRVMPETRGGSQAIQVTPSKVGAVAVCLWVSDDGEHVACSIGGGSWWDQAVPLEKEHILKLLSTVAAGDAWEELRRFGSWVVSRRGFIDLPGNRLTYGHLFSLPGLTWKAEPHEPY